MIKHLVLLKFKENIAEEKIVMLEEMLGHLPSVIPEINGYLYGRNVIFSARSYDFALVSDFEDLEALKRYQVHPEHLKVVEHLHSVCDSIILVDFSYDG